MVNLHKKCIKCHGFFPAKPTELKIVCDKKECQKYLHEYHFHTIKSNRYIPMAYFDIYDLDRPTGRHDNDFERVCRVCGEPLFNKNGKYSYHRRYCGNHTGYTLWANHNWGEVSKKYARKIRDANADFITKEYNKRMDEFFALHKEKPKWMYDKLNNITICEECKNLCQIYSGTSLYNRLHIETINIHHKTPVHILTWENINLIWDESNFLALCIECHNKQDHKFKKKVIIDPYKDNKKITVFL